MQKHGLNEFSNKTLLVIAPHIDDEAIGCGAFLFSHAFFKVHIVYAVSGVRGVTDAFAGKRDKSEIRKREGQAFCNKMNFTPHFLDLPFYERGLNTYEKNDFVRVLGVLNDIKPDIIFICDEQDDPHGTHGIIRDMMYQVLLQSSVKPQCFGYTVWADPYIRQSEADIVFGFDKSMMQQKKELIKIFKCQVEDPAHAPREDIGFVEMARRLNRKAAKENSCKFPFAEVFRKIL